MSTTSFREDAAVLAENPNAPDKFLESLYGAVGTLKYDFRNRNLNRLVVGLVVGDAVLDVGCGTGSLVAKLRRQGMDAIGLEPNPNLIDIADSLNPSAAVLQGSGEDVGELGRHFDAVTMIDVLEHILDDLGQLQLLHRCLKPGGQLVVVVPAHQWLFGERDRLNGHHRRYSRKRLRWALRATGFRVEKIRSWNVLGVLPYWFSERILGRPLEVRLRSDEDAGLAGRLLRNALDLWFRHVENRLGFGCGLSLVCVARKPEASAEPAG